MNKTLILVVEDDKSVQNLMVTTLRAHDYRYLTAVNAETAVLEASSHNPDIILLDLGLPDADGIEVIRKIRTWYNVPIIIISARSEDKDKVEALDAGADDYLVKPFDFSELMARLRALGRRSSQKIQQEIMELGKLTVDRTSKLLKKGGQVIQLSPREFQLFDLLLQNKGNVVPRDIILDRVWGMETDVSTNNIDSYMKLLRKKLEQADGGIAINTVRGVGYKLESE